MLEIVSACELRPSGVLWQSPAGELLLTVVAKATYALAPGESPLAEHQDDPTEYDDHWDDDEARSLRAASDLVPFKARADVILVGRVFAPGGRPARSVTARMLVAGVDKSVEVFCDRVSRQDGSLREGAGFVTMPLYWERAAGGPGTANPVGVRADGPRDTYGMLALPNLQPAGLHVTSHLDFIPPVGFGPVAPTWPPRLDRLHARLADWDHRRWHLAPLPADLDPAFFNAAPIDQQADEIRPDERIVLENLDPDHPRLVTSLSRVAPSLVIESGAGSKQLGMRCDTLVIDTDRRVCTLTWRAQVPIDDRRRKGRAIVTTSAAAAAWRDAPVTATFVPTSAPGRAPSAMPFQDARPSLGAARAPSAMPDRTLDAPLGEAMPALPFRVGRSPLAGTVLGALGPPVASPPPPVVPPSFQTPPSAPPPPAPVAWSPSYPPPPAFAPPPPMFHSEPPPMVRSEPPPMVREEPSYADEEEAPALDDGDAEPVEEWAEAEEEQEDAEAIEEPEAELEPEPEPEPPPPPPPPIEQYPLERCAAIAARLAHGKRERAKIFEEEELDPEVWPRLHRHWLDDVRAAESRGQTGPSERYDDAYVAALEAGRGKMTPKEYARLLVATERGRADEAMEELDLPKGAFLRVQRVWLRRTAKDAELGKAARAALDAARKG